MHLKKSGVLFLTLCLSSCAINYEKEKSILLAADESPDLVNNFEINKKQADDFKTTPVSEIKIVKDKKVKNKKLKKTNEKVEVTKEEKKSIMDLALAHPLPENYPEDFKKYDTKSKEAWSKFKPEFYHGEQTIMSVSFLGVTAGFITILSKEVVALNNKLAYHYYARFKSSEAYRYFYWLDDKIDSFVEKETYLPMKYSLVQREKKQDVDDLQIFDFKKMMTYHWYKRVKKDSNKEENLEQEIPRLAQDSFSALQFVRGLPLVQGNIYEFPVITRGKFWLLKVEIMEEENIEIMGKKTPAIKIRAETNFPGVLKKSGDIFFWYGKDPERRLLKFQAKVKIGSITGKMIEYKPGIRDL